MPSVPACLPNWAARLACTPDPCCRVLLEPVVAPRSRLDAGTWGTMGVGPGYAIAAAVVSPDRWVATLCPVPRAPCPVPRALLLAVGVFVGYG